MVYTNLRSLVAGRGSGYHGCDDNDILHVLIPPATHHITCTMPLYTHGDAYTTVCMDGWIDGGWGPHGPRLSVPIA